MPEGNNPPKKPEPIYGLYGPDYAVEKYDFQKYKRSNPPDIDDEPIIKSFPKWITKT